MGLFGGKGKAEALETKADDLLSRDPLEAYRIYKDALRKVDRREAGAVERLQSKAREARRGFVRAKIEEADRFVEDEVYEAAEESIAVAREHVEPEEKDLAAELDAAAVRIRQAEKAHGETPDLESPEESLTEAEESIEYVGVPEEDEGEPEEAERLDAQTDFEMYAGILGNDFEHAAHLGERFKQGFVAYQMGNREEALKAFQETVSEHPDDALAHEFLGQALDATGAEGLAVHHYQAALQKDPLRANARLALAQILSALSKPPEQRAGADTEGALKLLAEGERIDPAHAVPYRMTGAEIRIGAGRAAEAAEIVEKMIDGELAHDATAWQIYATALEVEGNEEEAEKAYRRLVQLSGAAMGPRAMFAEFALRRHRALDEAEKMIFDTCIGCQMTRPSEEQLDRYGVLLSRIQIARGEYKAAFEGIERLLSKGAPPDLVPVLKEMREQARQGLGR